MGGPDFSFYKEFLSYTIFLSGVSLFHRVPIFHKRGNKIYGYPDQFLEEGADTFLVLKKGCQIHFSVSEKGESIFLWSLNRVGTFFDVEKLGLELFMIFEKAG